VKASINDGKTLEGKVNKLDPGIIYYPDLPVNVTDLELFYKYKNIRLYRHIKDGYAICNYWISVLLVEESVDNIQGKLIPCLDIRSLPNWDDKVSTFLLFKQPQKIIPKIIREALKSYLTEDMFVNWSLEMDQYLINEI